MSGWIKIKLSRLAFLVERRRWQWRTEEMGGAKKLRVVSARGVVWEFRLNRGAWIRRRE